MQDYNPDTDPGANGVADPSTQDLFEIDVWQIKLIACFDEFQPTAPYKHVYAFVKNDPKMSRLTLKDLNQAIRDILTQQGVNFGILMFMQGTYVFTEVPVSLNALIIKLASGINFNGEVSSSFMNLPLVNQTLGR